MITMVIIAAVALMLTFGLMRSTSRGARRDRSGGIRWQGIDWSAGSESEPEPEAESEKSESESESR